MFALAIVCNTIVWKNVSYGVIFVFKMNLRETFIEQIQKTLAMLGGL